MIVITKLGTISEKVTGWRKTLGILSNVLLGFVFIVVVILIILFVMTLEDPEWWTILKGMSLKKKILTVLLLMVSWIVIQIIFDKIW